MRTLRQLLEVKNRPPVTVSPDITVHKALLQLAKHDIGAVLVIQDGRLAGILSERDCVRKLDLQGRGTQETLVGDIMTTPVQYVTLQQSVPECMGLMTERRIRHLPVLETDGTVVGILSIGDLVKETLADQAFTIDQLTHYITGT